MSAEEFLSCAAIASLPAGLGCVHPVHHNRINWPHKAKPFVLLDHMNMWHLLHLFSTLVQSSNRNVVGPPSRHQTTYHFITSLRSTLLPRILHYIDAYAGATECDSHHRLSRCVRSKHDRKTSPCHVAKEIVLRSMIWNSLYRQFLTRNLISPFLAANITGGTWLARGSTFTIYFVQVLCNTTHITV